MGQLPEVVPWNHAVRDGDSVVVGDVRGEELVFVTEGIELEHDWSDEFPANFPKPYYLGQDIFYLIDNMDTGDVFYDLGANVGTHSCTIGVVRPDVEIVAIEPHAQARERLKQNLAVNDIDATVYGYGIGGTNTNGWWYGNGDGHSGMAQVQTGDFDKEKARGEIPIRTLETVIADCDVSFPNAVKADIEGFEVGLMESSSSVFATSELKHSVIETHPNGMREQGESPGFVQRKLNQSGFQTHQIGSWVIAWNEGYCPDTDAFDFTVSK